jgi:hypothetical protein
MEDDLFLKDIVERNEPSTLRPIGATVGCAFPTVHRNKDYSRYKTLPSTTSSGNENHQSGTHPQQTGANSLESFRVSSDPAPANAPAVAVTAELLQKLEKASAGEGSAEAKDVLAALGSSLAQHRLIALRALIASVRSQSSTSWKFSPSSSIVNAVAKELAAQHPKSVCVALSALRHLLQRPACELAAELYAELGVPRSDEPDGDSEDDQNEEKSNVQGEEDGDKVGDASLSLQSLHLPRAIPPRLLAAYPSVAEGSKKDGDHVSAFWTCLALAVTRHTAMGIVTDPCLIVALQNTVQELLLGRGEAGSAVSVTASEEVDSPFRACMMFFRAVTHHKDACFAIFAVPSARTTLESISHYLVDVASRMVQQEHQQSKSAVSSPSPVSPFLLEGAANFFLALRSAVRHGISRVLRDFGPQLVQSTQVGSLAVMEMCLLSVDDDVTSATQRAILDECARIALQLVQRSAETPFAALPLHEQLVGPATALHYLATYFAVEGSRSLVLFNGSAMDTQTMIQRALRTSVITPTNLAGCLVRLQRGDQDPTTYLELKEALEGRKNLAAQASADHGRLRLLVSCSSNFPVTRDPSVAFVEAVAAKFVDLCFVCSNVKKAVFPDELCLGVEAVVFLADGCNAGAGVSMVLALTVLHCMALTKHCLDAAPRVADLFLRKLCGGELRDADIASAVLGLTSGLRQHASLPSPPWPQVFMEHAPLQWSHWIVPALSLHAKAKSILGAPRLFAAAVLHAAKMPATLTSTFFNAILTLLGATLACSDDGMMSGDDSSWLSAGVQPVLENLFGDPLPSALAAFLCASLSCMAPKSSLSLLQALIEVDRDGFVVATIEDHHAVWSVISQSSCWVRRWALGDLLDLVQRTAGWLDSTAQSCTGEGTVHILRAVIAEMIRRTLARPDIRANAFTREAVAGPLVQAGLAEEFDIASS